MDGSQVESCMIMPNSNIIPCISSCKLMNFNFNGNVLAKRKVMGKANHFDTSSFMVGDRSRISKALVKMCRREIVLYIGSLTTGKLWICQTLLLSIGARKKLLVLQAKIRSGGRRVFYYSPSGCIFQQ